MTFQRFFARCTLDILMNLFSKLMEAINRHDTLTFNEVFVDGSYILKGLQHNAVKPHCVGSFANVGV